MEADKKDYTPEDVVRIAVEIERRGQVFYAGLVNRFEDQVIRDIFQTMLEDEENHEHLFNEFLENYSEDGIKDSYKETGKEFIENLASSHIFQRDNSVEEKLNKISSPAEAIDLAIDFEKDSVVFFSGMKEFVFEDKLGVIDKLAKEEMLHVVRLLDLKKKYFEKE